MLADERVAHRFDDVDMSAQRSHQTKFLSAVTGGPMQYEGDDMETAHEGLGVTDAEFDAIAGHLDAALREFDVDDADREAVMETVEGYRDDIVEE